MTIEPNIKGYRRRMITPRCNLKNDRFFICHGFISISFAFALSPNIYACMYVHDVHRQRIGAWLDFNLFIICVKSVKLVVNNHRNGIFGANKTVSHMNIFEICVKCCVNILTFLLLFAHIIWHGVVNSERR